MDEFSRPLTSLGGDDGDVVPVVALPVQLHGRGDEAGVRRDTEQSLRVRLGINGEPGGERKSRAGGGKIVEKIGGEGKRGIEKNKWREEASRGGRGGAE